MNIIEILNNFLNNLHKRSLQPKKVKIVDYTKDRQYVGHIIINVLTERINVQKALLLFPKDSEDPSIQAAWHALCHYEADEDISSKDNLFLQEQLEYLEFIAFTFKEGKELPQNIIDSYKQYHEEALIPHAKGLGGLVKKLFKSINT